jgi:polar amino acid transport system substrate-binding protein
MEGIVKLSVVVLGLALCLGALALPGPAQAQEPLRIAYPEFPPFHWRDGQGRMAGFFHEIIVEAVQRRLGIPAVWTPLPWARCQASVREGSADAILTVPTAERLEYAAASPEPFYSKRMNVFTTSGHPRLAEIRALARLEDIRAAGFTVVTYSENGWSKANVEPLGITAHTANSLQSVWRMLAAGRGDLVIEWPPAAWPDIRALGLEPEIIQTEAVMASMPFHLLVGRNSPHAGILPEFSRAIRAMREDGSMERILGAYR